MGALEGLFGLSGSIKHLGAIASPLADDKKFLVTVALDGGDDHLILLSLGMTAFTMTRGHV